MLVLVVVVRLRPLLQKKKEEEEAIAFALLSACLFCEASEVILDRCS